MSDNKIKIGVTELHGIAKEVMANPPDNVEYFEVKSTKVFTDYIFKSPAKGVLNYFKGDGCDILEAPLFPILTNKPWVYTPARFSGATSFNILGLPIPRSIRIFFIKQLMLRKNFLKLVFKSQAGLESLKTYGNISDQRILDKVDVVYPCMRRIDPSLIKYNNDKVNFLFSGDFFLKGGANVVDAFERLQKNYNNISLQICSLPDLRIKNKAIRNEYLDRIKKNPKINLRFVDRKEMLDTVLPDTDVFVSPTYQEAFGFAILEASAYGIPVISTNHFAIPEIVEHGKSGYLIDTNHFEFISKGKVCVLNDIPKDFHAYMSEQVYKYMEILVKDPAKRREMGQRGLEIATTRFSFEQRNQKMKKIYEEGLRLYNSK
jgi:glycosyltransferase involved in cell wall biosynthesis